MCRAAAAPSACRGAVWARMGGRPSKPSCRTVRTRGHSGIGPSLHLGLAPLRWARALRRCRRCRCRDWPRSLEVLEAQAPLAGARRAWQRCRVRDSGSRHWAVCTNGHRASPSCDQDRQPECRSARARAGCRRPDRNRDRHGLSPGAPVRCGRRGPVGDRSAQQRVPPGASPPQDRVPPRGPSAHWRAADQVRRAQVAVGALVRRALGAAAVGRLPRRATWQRASTPSGLQWSTSTPDRRRRTRRCPGAPAQ